MILDVFNATLSKTLLVKSIEIKPSQRKKRVPHTFVHKTLLLKYMLPR